MFESISARILPPDDTGQNAIRQEISSAGASDVFLDRQFLELPCADSRVFWRNRSDS